MSTNDGTDPNPVPRTQMPLDTPNQGTRGEADVAKRSSRHWKIKSILQVVCGWLAAAAIVYLAGSAIGHLQDPIISNAFIVNFAVPGTPPGADGTGIDESGIAGLELGQSYRLDKDGKMNRFAGGEMLALFKTPKHFHFGPPETRPNYTVQVITRIGNKWIGRRFAVEYDYVSATGEMGRGNSWWYVPAKLRDWIKAIPVPKHTRYRVIRPYGDRGGTVYTAV